MRFLSSLALGFLLALPAGGMAQGAALRFEVVPGAGVGAVPVEGRVLVVLGRAGAGEPRLRIGSTGLNSPPVLGKDVQGFGAGAVTVLDGSCAVFPLANLAQLPAGEYQVQAVLHHNRDLNLPNAPGNLYSEARKVTLDPARGGTVRLELTRQVPDEEPKDTATVHYLRMPSKLLSAFHGRPMVVRAAVVLPQGYDPNGEKRYPLRVHIGGYGTRYTAARFHKATDVILLQLDGAGPYGDPYQVNSANNGPYGDALTQELIPLVEARYRCVGKPHARFLDGASTGGWVSLALQVFYPDYFNGCWSQCPDPVDFRAYELINIYQDENAYVNRHGFERPAKRQVNGETVYTVRHECQVENVLGRGDRWWLSGKDWCAWNATFGPRGDDGHPKPLWDGKTGKLDRSVVEHWKKYDLRLILEQNWPALEPKLRGKIRVWVGDADDYFLNNAVHLLEESLKRAQPPFAGRVVVEPGAGHRTGWDSGRVVREMLEAAAKGPR